GCQGSARAFQTTRTRGKRRRHLQCASNPRGISLCLLVPRPLFAGNQGYHDSEAITIRKKDSFMKPTITLNVIALLLALGFTNCGKQTGTSQAERTANAVASYVAPGEKDEYYLFYSGGHSGQVYVAGIPSLRHISTIPVFAPYPATGYGFDEE